MKAILFASLCVLIGCPTDQGGAKGSQSTLEAQGYTDVLIHMSYGVSYGPCGDFNDGFDFTAKREGKPVYGLVCCTLGRRCWVQEVDEGIPYWSK